VAARVTSRNDACAGDSRRQRARNAAFDVWCKALLADDATRPTVRSVYGVLLDELEQSQSRAHPRDARAPPRDVAYSIACVVGHNVVMQHFGLPRTRSLASRRSGESSPYTSPSVRATTSSMRVMERMANGSSDRTGRPLCR
jgi:hypothetical protein